MDVEKLISEVFIRVPLWNQAHPDHHNRNILKGFWNEVSNELGCKRDAVQKKWKYLRDYFRTECSKKIKPKSGDPGGKEFTSSWPYYESMKFILDQMTNRPSSGNLSISTGTDSRSLTSVTPVVHCSPVICEQGNNDQIDEEELSLNDEQFDEMFHTADNDVVSEATATEEPRCVLTSRKRKSQSEIIGSALINLEKQKLQYLRSKNSAKQPESNTDEGRSFFESLIPHVKMIKQDHKLLFRNEIQQVVQWFAYCTQSSTTSPAGYARSTPISFTSSYSAGSGSRQEDEENKDCSLLTLG